jgi:hypothetical protein
MGRDPEYVARFMREATTAGRMEHPNIVQIHDVGYAGGFHFIVMQHIDGESLSTVVEHLGAMEPRDGARIAAGILRGLHHAHEQGIVHRDVKPDNVLIAKGDQPMLLDFGLAIETESALQITKDGMVVGTPYYLSPEQARGQKATPLSDLYAAGVTLYYLLTGKRPFVGATALAVLNQHIHEPPVAPVKLKPEIPKPLSDIVLKMMAKRPEDRYPDAAAAADDLDGFLQGRAIRARIPLRLSSLTKQHKILAGAGAGVLAILLLIVIFSRGSGTPIVSRPDLPPAPTGPVESPELFACVEFEKKNKDDVEAYPQIVDKYEALIAAASSPELIAKTRENLQTFLDFVGRRAQARFDEILKEPDLVMRLRQIEAFPKPLKEFGAMDRFVREELPRILNQIETRYAGNEKKLTAALDDDRFADARQVIDDMLRTSDGARLQRLEKLKGDLDRRETEFADQILHKLSREYGPIHEAFEKALAARDNVRAYTGVTAFLRGIKDDAERSRALIPQTNYDAFLSLVPDNTLLDVRLSQARDLMLGAVSRAQATLPYLIFADLQDALDVEFLVRAAGQGIRDLSAGTREVTLATFNATGCIKLGGMGLMFHPGSGGSKALTIGQLHPRDLVFLAAVSEGLTPEKVYESKDLLSRAAGAAYLHSHVPERWVQALRWFRRAGELGVVGIGFRLELIREHAFREVREFVAQAKAEAGQKKFDAARKRLGDIAAICANELSFKQEIDRALVEILTAELHHFDGAHDFNRVKQTARMLRTSHAGQYDEETVHRIYAEASRSSGYWHTIPTGLKDDAWTWQGRAEGTPSPATDETLQGRGIRLKGGQSVALHPLKLRGGTGFTVQLSVHDATRPFTAGLRFDVSDADRRRLRLVLSNGEVALYRDDGAKESRMAHALLEKKIVSGQWVDLAWAVEGDDLLCTLDQRLMFIVTGAPGPDRGIALTTTGDANFRAIQMRK